MSRRQDFGRLVQIYVQRLLESDLSLLAYSTPKEKALIARQATLMAAIATGQDALAVSIELGG